MKKQQFSPDEKTESATLQAKISLVMSMMGRKGGLKGGKKRAEVLSPKRRSEIAQIAAKARWKK